MCIVVSIKTNMFCWQGLIVRLSVSLLVVCFSDSTSVFRCNRGHTLLSVVHTVI
jgi:hypothetical protein